MVDDIGAALWWQPSENDTHWAYAPDGSLVNTTRPALPTLAANATPDDQRIYQLIQQLYQSGWQDGGNSDPQGLGPQLVQEAQFNPGASHTDPNILNFLGAQNYNANLKDVFSPWGDEFFTALLGLGLVTGAAGAYTAAYPAAGAAAGGAEAFAGPAVEGAEALTPAYTGFAPVAGEALT